MTLPLTALALPVPLCPMHSLPLSLGPVVYHCDAGQHGHRVQAADLEVAAESRWQDRARCAEVDTEIFFPENGGLDRPAKKICAGCEVRAECLEFAVDNDEIWGIWGGFSERERRNMKREAA